MQIQTSHIPGWRWIFLVEGLLTVSAGLVGWFFLVDFPQKTTFISPSEQFRVIERLNEDRGDGEAEELTFAKVRHHLKDSKIWGFGLIVSS